MRERKSYSYIMLTLQRRDPKSRYESCCREGAMERLHRVIRAGVLFAILSGRQGAIAADYCSLAVVCATVALRPNVLLKGERLGKST